MKDSAKEDLRFFSRRRLPVLLQSEAGECGLVCLAMISAFHRRDLEMPSLRRHFATGQSGMAITALNATALKLGLSSQILKLDLQQLHALRMPCILHWRFNHYVVLKAVSKRGLVIHDPSAGKREVSWEEANEAFTGLAVECWAVGNFERKPKSESVPIKDLLGQINGLPGLFGHAILLALALEVFTLISPLFMQWVVDGAIVTADLDLLSVLVLGFALLLLIQVSIGVARSWLLVYTAANVNLQWLDNVFRHLVRLPMAYFQRRHMGDVVSRFDAVRIIQRIVTTNFVEAVLDGSLAILILVAMFFYSAPLTVVVLLSSAIYVILRAFLYGPLRRKTEERTIMTARETTHFFETIRGIQSVKLFGIEERRRQEWRSLVVGATNREVEVQRLTIGFRSGNALISGFENLIVVWIAAQMVIAGTFSIGMLYAFMAYKLLFTSRVTGVVDKYFEFRMLGLQAERLGDIVLSDQEGGRATETEPSVGGELLVGTDVDNSIELDGVSFRYSDSDPWVLHKCSFQIGTGESVAVVGASGCGKTTLAKIVLGLLVPQEGEVRIGGVPIASMGAERLRSIAGAVMQDDFLFAGTIAENIAISSPLVDHERVVQCAKAAAVDAEIQRMPMQYESLIGDMGSALSGGQKQRILIARALYKQPRFLVLDEATSHLDVSNERAVNTAIQNLNLTRLVIAHRPETILSAQRVIKIEGGTALTEMRVLQKA